MSLKNIKFSVLTVAAMLLAADSAWSAGYERSIMWGARSAGVAGIATPYITGAQSLYFNPAGLANEQQGGQLTLQVSPVFSQFKGPINNQNEEVTSKQLMSTPFGLIYSRTVDEKLGYAVGGYVSGGSKVTYENVDLGTFSTLPFSETGEVKTDMTITEVAAGVGYRVNEQLKIGASWRVVMADAAFSLLQRLPDVDGPGPLTDGAAIANLKLTGLKDTQYTGFKFGAQYRLSEKTTFGASFRSEVNLNAKGRAGGRIITPSAALDITEVDMTAKTTFPMALTLGAMYDMNEQWKMMWEYVFTQYSKVDVIQLEGDITVGAATISNPTVEQQWKDQHNARLAGEYLGTPWPVRFGYVYTSQVTSSDFARASFTPPGAAHTLTLGTGQMLTVQEKPLQFDIAAEYTTTSGDGKGAAAGDQVSGTDIRAGSYGVTAYGVHAGLTYAF